MANWDDTELPAPWDWKKFLPPEYNPALALLPGMDTNRASPGPGDFGGPRAPSVVPGNAPVLRPAIGALKPGDPATFGQSWSSTPRVPSITTVPPSIDPERQQQPLTGPGNIPGVVGVPPGSGTAMPDGGPGLGGFGTVKPTGNPQKADEDGFWAKVLKMSQDKNFMGALDALGLGAGKAPQGSPPKFPKAQMSPATPLRPYPTVTSEAKGILAGASGPASLDMLKPLPGASKNAPLQKRYDLLNKRQAGLTQLLQELG
jgi:hypothetical protein